MKENVYQNYFQILSDYPEHALRSVLEDYPVQTPTQIVDFDLRPSIPFDFTLVNGGILNTTVSEFPIAETKTVRMFPRKHFRLTFDAKKRIFDIIFSMAVMLAGLPVFVFIYLITKISSPGPAFYKQERLGQNKRIFHIYKFRSMRTDAEKFGPQLSSTSDPRITKWGRVIRRTRLDELPQFWNVLRGDMSVVGPRPERAFFAEKIIERRPEYGRLHRIKPGITSLGQVHYGYAENLEQMCARLDFDMEYITRGSLKSDFDIILKTVRVMVQGKGK